MPAITVATARFEEYRAIEDEHTRLAEDVPTHEDKLKTRQLVDMAKAVLMDNFGMGEDVAFSFIQRTAMDRSRPDAGRPRRSSTGRSPRDEPELDLTVVGAGWRRATAT